MAILDLAARRDSVGRMKTRNDKDHGKKGELANLDCARATQRRSNNTMLLVSCDVDLPKYLLVYFPVVPSFRLDIY